MTTEAEVGVLKSHEERTDRLEDGKRQANSVPEHHKQNSDTLILAV